MRQAWYAPTTPPATGSPAASSSRIGYSSRSLNRICLAAIGHRLGFSEATNFTKFFTRETDMSPGAFRQ